MSEPRFISVINNGVANTIGSNEGYDIAKAKIDIPDDVLWDIFALEKAYSAILRVIFRSKGFCGSRLDELDGIMGKYVETMLGKTMGTKVIPDYDDNDIMSQLAKLFSDVDFGEDEEEYRVDWKSATEEDMAVWAKREADANERTSKYLNERFEKLHDQARDMIQRALLEFADNPSPITLPSNGLKDLEHVLEELVNTISLEEALTFVAGMSFSAARDGFDVWEFIKEANTSSASRLVKTNEYLHYMDAVGESLAMATEVAINYNTASPDQIISMSILGAAQVGHWLYCHLDELEISYNYPKETKDTAEQLAQLLDQAFAEMSNA